VVEVIAVDMRVDAEQAADDGADVVAEVLGEWNTWKGGREGMERFRDACGIGACSARFKGAQS
jgi:hypothetical protein